jgi:thiol-disulfide isomerase/thioredoxin
VVEDPGSTPSAGLADRILALEERVALLEGDLTRAQAREEEAGVVYEALRAAHKAGDYAIAHKEMAALATDYGETDFYKRSRRIESELSLFDSPIPADAQSHIQRWLTSETSESTDGSLGWSEGTSLVVFWERWCPACRNQLPELQQLHDTWSAKGLKIMALTRITRNETQEGVDAFVQEGGYTLPIGKEDGLLASYFKVQALPAAAIIQDGVITWRGDPQRITDTELEGWLQD